MKPIINPWIFYFTNISNNLKFVLYTAIIVLGVLAIIFICSYFSEYDCYDRITDKAKLWHKNFISCLIPLIICLFFVLFIPSESTIYKMTAAKFATSKNIETVYDKIIDSAAKLGEAWNSDKESEDK